MEFQMGDRVRIRHDLALFDSHEPPGITDEMLRLAGSEATIHCVNYPWYYVTEFPYAWNDRWLELIEEDEQTEYEKLNLDSVL